MSVNIKLIPRSRDLLNKIGYFRAQFTPETSRIERGIIYAKFGIVGYNNTPLQFTAGTSPTMPVVFFVDEYINDVFTEGIRDFNLNLTGDEGHNPVTKVEKVIAWFETVTSTSGAFQRFRNSPPELIFSWGNAWAYRVVIERSNIVKTMFLSDGSATRANIEVNLQRMVDFPV